MSVRRRSSLPKLRTTAQEANKSLELEQRISHLELTLQDLRQSMEAQAKRSLSLQAQLDHLDARLRGV